ncbi:MAG: iron ABC transporter permease [Chloroflexi bacterium]|nr:iron ABC transporter permease [Chloroflexota bacterium]
MAGLTAEVRTGMSFLVPRGRSRRHVALACAGVLALAVIGLLTMMFGAVNLSAGEALSGLTAGSDSLSGLVVGQIRLPRFLDAVLVGGSLGVAGALLQGVTRNPLGDPTIFGLTGAAGLATAVSISINPQIPQWGIALAAMIGGLGGAGILFVIAYRGAVSPVRLALAGVALSALFGAIIVGLIASVRTFIQTTLGFLAGGLYGSDWSDLRSILPYAIPALAAAVALAGRLNVLSLGDEVATGLGVLADRTRLAILVVAGILTASAVAVAGLVGFVGLLSPHIARYVAGSDNRYLIPASALVGAIIVAGADLVAKLIIMPSEIPMGIITAAIGAPFLLYLVRFKV